MRALRIEFAAAAVISTLLFASAAHAVTPQERKEAQRLHDQGVKHYNVGRFDEAIDEFERAYDLEPDPILLFNLAQAHRQRGDAERAIFFYKRYLQMAPRARDRAEVQRRVEDLEKIIAQQREVKEKPPAEVKSTARDPDPDGDGKSDGPGTARATQQAQQPPPQRVLPPPQPQGPQFPAHPESSAKASAPSEIQPDQKRLRLTIDVGTAIPLMHGADNVRGAMLLVLRAGAGYAIADLGATALEVGLNGGFSPLPYRSKPSNSEERSNLLDVFASVGIRTRSMPVFGTATLGPGIAWWQGLGRGNPFTAKGEGASGAIPMLSFRAAGAGLWQVTEKLQLGATASYTVSKTSGDALSSAVPALSRIEISAVIAVGL